MIYRIFIRNQTLIVVALVSILAGCTTFHSANNRKKQENPGLLYHAPMRDPSRDLEAILKSVKKIYSVSSYTTWQFRREQNVSGYGIMSERFKKLAMGVISTSETASGTATVIRWVNKKLTLLTCAHIVHSPDTLISYFEPVDGDPARYIQSISIKEKQENWIRDFSVCGSFPVVLMNNESDIAILEKSCESLTDTIPVLQCQPADARLVDYGHLVYIIGYPHGNLMITNGLASPLPKRPDGEFTVDALLNKGYSGGIVLAVSQDEQFLFAGMVERVISENLSFLKPAGDQLRTPEWIPYTGAVHTGNTEIMNYGLNQIIPVNKIMRYIKP